ncbi:GNAT family N-acetyltransferase [Streptomyces sp. NPDC006430]|uniref:GNAT family N-acetyltransferase n=1 Tax=Streptomyces sp. NPDC006430 TaxID=3154299 RepID=UPI0033A64C6F
MTTAVLTRLEQYYDAAPRVGGARAEDFGPLTLFVREGAGWPYYARPALGARAASVGDVQRVLARQRELDVPQSFEWVAETSPWLQATVEAAGLHVHTHPLMVLEPSAVRPPLHPDVRLLGADDPLLRAAVAVAGLAFATPGTATGEAGPAELATAIADPLTEARRAQVSERLASGRTALAAAVCEGVVLASGQYNPVGDTAEVVGVGTLPAARRQGLGLGVTSALVADALSRGTSTVFLSADDDDVARIYSRLGFRRVATALIAEPAA